jgi:hypothetical protein
MSGGMEGFRSERLKTLVPAPLAKLVRKEASLAKQSHSEYIADMLKAAHPGWRDYKGGAAPEGNRDKNMEEYRARIKATDAQRTGKDEVSLATLRDAAKKKKKKEEGNGSS